MDPTEIINKEPSIIPEPRDAVTVILARESDQPPFQILLMRRHKNQSFMGGAFVFPGGKLDGQDCSPLFGPYARGLSPEEAKQKLNEPDLPGDKAGLPWRKQNAPTRCDDRIWVFAPVID